MYQSILDALKKIALEVYRLKAQQSNGTTGATATPRHRPCAFAVDRQASTCVIHFDNGCTLPIPPTYSRIYPYSPHKGEPYGAAAGSPSEYDPILTILWLSRGLITLSDLSGLNGISRFVGVDWVVQNPVQDPAQFNWSRAMFSNTDTSGPSKRGQPFFLRTLYALGIVNEQTALDLGAVKI
ncbi:hypothetical protein BKK52_10625 [Rodentibacter trehalosifermentans]|uniref:Uncharacterized protein n=1 Tax=Rodentibacter trehalosifermentans TaxID=1908263 RepID=A0A1V3IXA6_9PAST|nr:hypothetical protein [Rodentibacter trehalosifermentans]OOF46956.1 hypothetical protein BKK52_10625 [Rodentibacter trehalosifermentans]